MLFCGTLMAAAEPGPATQQEQEQDQKSVEAMKQEIARLKDELAKRDAEIEAMKKKLADIEKTQPGTAVPQTTQPENAGYPHEWVTSFKLAEKNREAEIKKINAEIKDNEQKLLDPKIGRTGSQWAVKKRIKSLEKKGRSSGRRRFRRCRRSTR